MDYNRIYDSIVGRAQNRVLIGYGENHHIIPRGLGGGSVKSNIVKLTAREHYIAHLCLYRFTTGENQYKMSLAVMLFNKRGCAKDVRTNSRLYEQARQKVAAHMRQIRLGTTVGDETRQKMREAAKRWIRTPEHCKNISLAKKGRPVHSVGGRMTGKHHSPESRQKMRLSRIQYWERKRETCNGQA